METENIQKRKVLISVKVSTLFMILVSIIILSAIAVSVGNYVTAKESENNNLSETNLGEIKEEANVEEAEISEPVEVPTIQMSERTSATTSRSSERREISVVEEPEEEILEEETENLVVVSTPIEEVKISVDMDLTVRTGLSKEDFIKLMSEVNEDTSGFFEENAAYIYDVCEKYSLNEIFFCGLISAESGWNIAQNHRNTHNYISLMSSNGLIRFSSVEEGLEKAAQTLHDRYLTPGGSFYYGTTLAAMKTRFCPASPTWVNLVYGRMEQIMN